MPLHRKRPIIRPVIRKGRISTGLIVLGLCLMVGLLGIAGAIAFTKRPTAPASLQPIDLPTSKPAEPVVTPMSIAEQRRDIAKAAMQQLIADFAAIVAKANPDSESWSTASIERDVHMVEYVPINGWWFNRLNVRNFQAIGSDGRTVLGELHVSDDSETGQFINKTCMGILGERRVCFAHIHAIKHRSGDGYFIEKASSLRLPGIKEAIDRADREMQRAADLK